VTSLCIPLHCAIFLRSFHSYRQGFYAKPQKNADGTLNMMLWEVGIPGKQGVSSVEAVVERLAHSQTNWEHGVYKVNMNFPDGKHSYRPSCWLLTLQSFRRNRPSVRRTGHLIPLI
jgi:hypothetical protein